MRRSALLVVLLLPLESTALAQTHPNLERGLAVGKAYQIGDVLESSANYRGQWFASGANAALSA